MAASTFHLDKSNGKLMGVCAGVARYADVDVLLVRLGWLVLTLGLLHGWGVGLYLLAGWIADDRAGG